MTTGTRITTLTAAMAGMLLALPVCPATAASGTHKSGNHAAASSTAFIKEAAAGGMAEVELGKLAQERAQSDEVKSFAKRMVDDHSKANDELQQMAQKKNITLSKQLDGKHKALYDRLSKLSGAQFDRAYMDAMLQDHRHDVAAFERETKSSDADVRDFASRTLPTLQDHLANAQQVDRAVASSSSKSAHTSTAGTGQHRATNP